MSETNVDGVLMVGCGEWCAGRKCCRTRESGRVSARTKPAKVGELNKAGALTAGRHTTSPIPPERQCPTMFAFPSVIRVLSRARVA